LGSEQQTSLRVVALLNSKMQTSDLFKSEWTSDADAKSQLSSIAKHRDY